jgi:hypothetical protein
MVLLLSAIQDEQEDICPITCMSHTLIQRPCRCKLNVCNVFFIPPPCPHPIPHLHPHPLQIAKLAYKNKRFAAIDRAISRNGLKFVTLLRLSPLLPLAISNYLYGLTSVDLGSYVLGSWLGMLPGEFTQ